ncbi:similar to Saccharomyces cerevisiae YER101C AST2 Protein that may have a role in targeting of plasma membrane [H+]ATPase (Pma1p) to the plasma membrane [Maudiozyma barnettii]|uniref:Similar to Saccharomyces cerevisiae YER101C AST2 Protein that may have a role in targeting of plasma membrane [H+]ATPase (Pma1p) to the plasma membrane n=1 Tax=Maudiozyma barnettii TaxID=61262 RepID=A0A8H2ZGK5_9SACH|nr:similar to Saccharomyces cerevisiae YER101C AST2 Protein that may have a role in targeting of plasma membrane [H+]ATPase (Pma1p) to the plasma membrane [Kazachstania barnettii]CAB4252845.1 similar to Saccharomyces cerevisiae YER101C AST2 Protein that may have a role in targeting of plasma membrane [H+]ATPase (Pma1p) to the plasma membrane [Kazachstania barnettii]CAD1780640.1 similar to Saccharomyces cerevisiae YER101C AST2 Protein that may have a role in targeting of plasma membrane [H+]ATPase
MSKKVIKNIDPKLETETYLPSAPAPSEIKSDEIKLRRVARPIRNVRHIPIKSQVFHSKEGPLEFSYENKIKTPISKNKLVVQVSHVGLNPVDVKIRNGYVNPTSGEIGLGREYCGVVTNVGSDIAYAWHEGDEVFGIYYHPHLGTGALQSSLLIDPKSEAIAIKPKNVSCEEAAGTMFCLGSAFNILDRLQKNKYLTEDSNVLINGGTSSVGLFAIQLLKNYYKVKPKLVIVTSSNGPDILKKEFPHLADDMIFINYLTCRGKSSKPLRKMLKEERIESYNGDRENSDVVIPYTQGKFDIVLDFVGGYDILSHSSSLIHGKGAYVTTVGDYVADYKEDIFNSWDNPSANARKIFGSIIWSYDYSHFYFDPSPSTASKNEWIEKCCEFLANETVKCVIYKSFSWKKTSEALKVLQTQRAQGKIIIEVEKF